MKKLDFMKSLGADHVMNYRTEDYVEVISKALDKERIDVSFNPIAGKTFKKDFKLVGSGGKIILFGGSELGDGKMGLFCPSSPLFAPWGLMLPIALMMRSKSVFGHQHAKNWR